MPANGSDSLPSDCSGSVHNFPILRLFFLPTWSLFSLFVLLRNRLTLVSGSGPKYAYSSIFLVLLIFSFSENVKAPALQERSASPALLPKYA